MGPHRQLIEFRTLSHSAVLQQLSVSDSEYDTLRGIIEHELSQDSTAIPKYNFKTTVGKQSLINFIQTTLSREKLGRRKRSADLSWERLLLTVGMRTIRNARKRWIRAKHADVETHDTTASTPELPLIFRVRRQNGEQTFLRPKDISHKTRGRITVDDIVFNLFTQRLQEELSLNSDVEGIYHVWHGGEDSEVKSQRAFQALVQERLYSRASDITFGIRKKDDCVGHGGTSVSPPIDSEPLGNSAS